MLSVPLRVLRECLEDSRGTIGGLMKILKHAWFLSCFEHLAVLGSAFGVLGRSCGRPWGSLGDAWEVLERYLGILGGPWGVLGRSLGFTKALKKT